MGKIKVRTLGDESLENKQKEKSKQKAHEKKMVKGGKGGERTRLQMPGASATGGQGIWADLRNCNSKLKFGNSF